VLQKEQRQRNPSLTKITKDLQGSEQTFVNLIQLEQL
jgi:hypothetical protein